MNRVLLAGICLQIAVSTSAHASMCVNGRPSLEREYRESEYVVEGKVSRIVRDAATSYVYDGQIYHDRVDRVTVRVLSSFKKPSGKTLTFENPHNSAALPVQIGRNYLLFLSRSTPSEGLQVDTCGLSGLMDRES